MVPSSEQSPSLLRTSRQSEEDVGELLGTDHNTKAGTLVVIGTKEREEQQQVKKIVCQQCEPRNVD